MMSATTRWHASMCHVEASSTFQRSEASTKLNRLPIRCFAHSKPACPLSGQVFDFNQQAFEAVWTYTKCGLHAISRDIGKGAWKRLSNMYGTQAKPLAQIARMVKARTNFALQERLLCFAGMSWKQTTAPESQVTSFDMFFALSTSCGLQQRLGPT